MAGAFSFRRSFPLSRHRALLALLALAGLLPAQASAYCQSYWTAAYKCAQGCGSCGGGGHTAPSRDYEAERRQAEASERQRREEEERRQADEKRHLEEAAERQAAFIRSRDEAVGTLKGSIGNFDGELKGSNGYGAKDSDHGLKGSLSPEPLPHAGKKRAPAPHTDTTVVDARVPRDGAYLTAQLPELAQSPAHDRISKGFQAVMNQDWPVALAWWQDALRRDPGNAALQRSVALAQWMVDRRKAQAAGPVPPLGAAIRAAARGDTAEAIRQFERAKAENPESAKHLDSMSDTLRQKAAQQAKAAAISAEIEQQQISLVGELNDEGLKMLMVGEDRQAQELFDDAQFFAMGLTARQVRSYDSPYFGPMGPAPAPPPVRQPAAVKKAKP